MDSITGKTFTGHEIAIIGMACRAPGVANTDDFWQLSKSGKEGFSTFTREELKKAGVSDKELDDPDYVMKAGYLADKNLFDTTLFGYSVSEASVMDPQLAKFYECVWEALEQAGYYSGRVGVYAGTSESSTWLSRVIDGNDSLADTFSTVSLTGANFLSTRISHSFNFSGPSQNVQTTCSTSLVAVHDACQSLLTYQCNMALAGGSTITPHGKQGYLYQEGMIFSPDGCCRPFDANAAGTMDGEGVGVVVLKRLEDAIADNDNIIAVIKGSATNNDGNRKQGFTAPSELGQSEVIKDALETAEVDPGSIGYVEAHGTGTHLGDPIEIAGLTKAYGPESIKVNGTGYCVIGSIKSQIGHTESAAGVMGLIRTIHILQNKQFPPSTYFKSPNPELNLDKTPFRVNTELCDWQNNGPRRAGVSSFSIGGTNAHVILEEACFERQTSESRNIQMLFLSANTETALATIIQEQLQYLEQHSETSLPDLCYTRQVGRKPLRYRKAMAVLSIDELKQALSDTQDLTGNVQIHTGLASDDNKIGFLFPGQGMQYANMGKGLYETEPVFRQWLDKCFNIAQENSGIDFKASLFPIDKSDTSINQTENTQPLLFMLEYSLAQQLMHWGCKPDIMIGHSVGEYVAACLAGVFTLEDAITLIIKRGALIQALPPGDMLSVRTDKATIEPLLAALNQTKETVSIAAINSPELLVVSGDQDAIATLQTALDEKDILHSLLHTSHAFHSHHLDPALAEFKTAIEAITLSPPEPELPYISNVTGKRIDPEQATSPDYWVQHLRGCVQFSDGVKTLVEQESLALLEVGPGQVLSTFVQQNPAKTPAHHCINLMPGAQEITRVGSEDETSTMDQKALFNGLCKLFTLGTLLDWQAFYTEEKRGIVGDLPTYPFEGKAYWTPRSSNALGTSSTNTNLLAPQSIENWYSIPTWQPGSLPPPLQLTEEQKWLIFIDDHGVGNQVNQRLLEIDRQAVSVLMGQDYEQKNTHTFVINPAEPQHYMRLFAELEQQSSLPGTIIHLWGIDSLKQSENAAAITRRIALGFYSQLYLCQAFDQISRPLDISLKIVTNETQSLHPDENCYPEKALSLAPGRVIPAEYPFVTCQFIDCPLPDILGGGVNSARLIDELLSAQVQDKFIAYRGGLRWQQVYNPVSLPPVEQSPALLRQQGCYLITGGLGGLGLVLANYLARQGAGTIILLSRSGFIDKDQWEKWLSDHNINDAISQKIQVLKDIEATGSAVKIVTADVANATALKTVLTPWMKKTNRINGIFHTAGLASQGAIQLKQEKDLEYALAAKVTGTRNLHALFAKNTLDFIILSSSQTAIIGGVGEIDYCAANLFLDAFAQQHDNPEGTRYIAINWPAWNETGMAVNVKLSASQRVEHQDYLQTFGITSAQGMEALDRLISHPMFSRVAVGPHPIATLVDASAVFVRNQAERALEYAAIAGTGDALTEYVAPQSETEEKLTQIWATKLGIRQVSVTANLLQLGADSLQFISVSSELKNQFNSKLTFGELLQLTTIQQQAEVLDQHPYDKTDTIPDLIPLHKNSALASYSQQRLWFIAQLEQQQAVYNISFALNLKGALKYEVLRKVLETVIRRHTSLCTVFSSDKKGSCIQTVQEDFTFELPIVDLSALSKTEQDKQAADSISQEQTTEFDLSKDLLLRAKLIKQSEHHHILLLSMHHIASDGASVGILIEELNALYNTEVKAKPIPLPTLPVQYIDYSQWQREWFQGDRLEQDLYFWKDYLKGIPQVHNLPLDHLRPPQQSYNGSYCLQKIDQATTEKLMDLSQKTDTTLFMVMQAALAIFVSRYSNETDIVIGFPIANRGQKEVEPLIGFFINTLLLRSDLSNNPDFTELLAQTKENILSTYTHQHIPFELMVEEINPQRSLRHSPLFQIMLAYQHQQGDGISFSDLQATPIEIKGKYSKFDLNLEITETPDGLEVLWEYASDIFDDNTITRWAKSFDVLLKGIAEKPKQQMSKLPLLMPNETRQVIETWNKTEVSYPQDKCLHELFEERAENNPNKVALVLGERSFTNLILNKKSNQLAHYLIEQGVKPDILVGICVERSFDMMVGLLGILKAGGAYVPLDPANPKSRLQDILDDSAVDILLTQSHLQEKLKFSDRRIIYLDTTQYLDEFSIENIPKETLGLQAANLAYVIFTSGSTGKPKGVMINHENILNTLFFLETQYPVEEKDCYLLKTNYAFDVSLSELFGWFFGMGHLVILAPEEEKTPQTIMQVVSDNQVTHINFSPSMLSVFVEEARHQDQFLKYNCLKYIMVAGEAFPKTLVHDTVDLFQRAHIENIYGPTESSIYSAWFSCTGSTIASHNTPIGTPPPNTTLYVLDRELQPVPVGVAGELHIGGRGLARGYLNEPELTTKQFIQNPFNDNAHDRLYKTGDLVRWLADGNIEYLGRIDFQVKIRGFRIELGEIETQLAANEHIHECIVLAREDSSGEKRLVAYFIARNKKKSMEERGYPTELRQYLKQSLPDYMIPSIFVELEKFPVNQNGKIDRKALPEPDNSAVIQEIYVAPGTGIEKTLCRIWQEVLDVEVIGVHDNFFSLGGHSLIAIQVISRIRESSNIELPMQAIFTSPTVAELSTTLNQLPKSACIIMPAVAASDLIMAPPSFAQQRLWIISQLEQQQSIYNISGAYSIDGPLNIDILSNVLTTIIQRHSILRTVFKEINDQVTQVIIDKPNFNLAQTDLSHLSSEEQEQQIITAIDKEAVTPFDLSNDLMLRATLLKRANNSHILLISVHHIAYDGASDGILLDELAQLYEACLNGRQNPLPPLPIQYIDFALWQQDWLKGSTLQQQLTYWEEKLAGIPLTHSLPLDHPRPQQQSFKGNEYRHRIDQATTQGLNKIARQSGATLFMVLQAAWAIFMARYSNETDIVIGFPTASRTQKQIEPLIGFFVNTLIMRVDLSDDPSFTDLLTQTKRNILEAHNYQHIPFELLVEKLNPERSLSHSPVFQVMLVLQSNEGKEFYLPGVEVREIKTERQFSKFDLILDVVETPQGLNILWEYATDIFETSTIERWTANFSVLLKSILAQPQQNVFKLPLLTEREQQQVTVRWNNTSVSYPQDRCIHQLFEKQVQKTPAATAVVFEDQQLTYQELNQRSNQLAHYLIAEGVGKESKVGLCIDRSLEMMIGLLGIQKAGGAYVPIDPKHPQQRVAYMLEDSGIDIVLTQEIFREKLVQCERQHTIFCIDSEWEAMRKKSVLNPNVMIESLSLAYVSYTSGSTGKPKGVMVAHVSLLNHMLWMQRTFYFTNEDSVLQKTSLSFDASLCEWALSLITGTKLVLANADGHRDPDYLIGLIEQHQITVFVAVPSMLKLLLNHEQNNKLQSLRYLISGGEALPRGTCEQFAKLNLSARLYNFYGPTETTIDSHFWLSTNKLQQEIVPIGSPIDNMRSYILDEQLNPVPVGVGGELYIGGEGLARGYQARPDLTAEYFIPDTFSQVPGKRLYGTRDKVRYLADGNIEYIGRTDHQVKIRGFRIELGEIENALSTLPDVQEAVVLAHSRGEGMGNHDLTGYVVLGDEAVLDLVQLKNRLKEALPDYMIPSFFILLDGIPLTPNGKVDRKALPIPDDSAVIKQVYQAPSSEMETTMVKLWQQLLGIEQVSVLDNFFELGGNSLKIIELTKKINVQLNTRLLIVDLFTYPSISALCRFLTKGENAAEEGKISKEIANDKKKSLQGFKKPRRSA